MDDDSGRQAHRNQQRTGDEPIRLLTEVNAEQRQAHEHADRNQEMPRPERFGSAGYGH